MPLKKVTLCSFFEYSESFPITIAKETIASKVPMAKPTIYFIESILVAKPITGKKSRKCATPANP